MLFPVYEMLAYFSRHLRLLADLSQLRSLAVSLDCCLRPARSYNLPCRPEFSQVFNGW
jgi:hypothetical protein